MVEQVLKRPEQVVKLVVEALWNDFNGTGPDSGMWWHGNLSKVAQYAKSAVPKLNSPEDLLGCLRLEGLALAYHFYSKPTPLIDLMFWPAFEYEHALGVLTDGKRIVGIGYSLDVEPFKRKRRSTQSRRA